MLLPDINVLLAAYRADHVHHRPARGFMRDAYSATEVIGLSDAVLVGVARLATNPRVFVRPDPIGSVVGYLDALLEAPGQLVHSGPTHWLRFVELARHLQLRGNLIPDASLAALCLGHAAELVTFDRGFGRYPHLRWRCLLDD